MKKMGIFSLLLALVTLTMVGCGSDTPADPNAPATLTVTSSPASPQISTAATITANVLKADGTAVPDGVTVAFTTTGGTLSAASATTTGGNASVTLTSATAGAVTVTATAGGATNTVAVTFVNPNAPAAVTLTASPAQGIINAPVTLSAAVTRVAGGNVPDGTVVTFASSLGAVSAVTTTTNGVATATLNSATTGAATVTATAGSVTSAAVTVNFVDPNAPATVTLTASPAQGVTNNNVPVTLSAAVTRVAGGNVPDGTVVTFTSSLGTVSAVTTTTNGVATATLNSATAGTASVTARAGNITSAAVSVPFIAQPTQAIVTVALTGTLPQGVLIGGTTAKIAFNAANGLGAPVSARVGIGSTADIFAANVGVNPTNTGAAWSAGSPTGDLQTLTFPITAGFFPTAADFTVDATSSVIDLNNASLAGVISVTIRNVAIQ
jgi:adhesin/invasin